MTFWQKLRYKLLVFLDRVSIRKMTFIEKMELDLGMQFYRGPFRPNAFYLPDMGFLHIQFEDCQTVTVLGPCDWINLLEDTKERRVVGIQIHGFKGLVSPAFKDEILVPPSDERSKMIISIEEYLASFPPSDSADFKPVAWYNQAGDILHCSFESAPYRAELVHPCIHLDRALNDNRIVGVEIWGFKQLLRDPEHFLRSFAA